jgi:hypothetical protein
MAKYRKKPVVIEAVQWLNESDETTQQEIPFYHHPEVRRTIFPNPDGKLTIRTLEGDMIADIGDFIIKGVKGEIYPCKPDIFEQTYELVEE